MKKYYSIIALLATIVATSACVKEESEPVLNEETVHFYASSIETKTAFGTPDGTNYPTLWTDNDEEVMISYNLSSDKSYEVTPSDDFKTASFDATFTPKETGPHAFYALSPGSAKLSVNSTNRYIGVTIPSSQTPSDNSVDEASQILFAQSEAFAEFPSSVNFTFKHLTAYGRLTLKNLSLGEAEVSSITLTLNKPFAGRWNYTLETEELVENSVSNTITLNTNKVADVWFACAPVDLTDATMSITVNTNLGTYSRDISFAEGQKFTAGKIVKFSVNMSAVTLVTPKVYDLVKSVEELTPESKVILVAKDANYALSTTQNSNNRAQAAIVKSETIIQDPGADVQILTINPCFVKGTYSFATGDGFLYAASSSSNYLRTENNLSDNSTWKVDVSSEGVATVKAQGTNTRNWLRYNSSSSMFSCYASGQGDVQIYKLRGSGQELSDYLMVSQSAFDIQSSVTSVSLDVYSDQAWSINCESDDVTISPTSANGDANVTISFPKNTTANAVQYTLNVTSSEGSGAVKVTQAALPKLVMSSISKETTANSITYTWSAVTGATSYQAKVGNEGEWQTVTSPFTLSDLEPGSYAVTFKAIGNNEDYLDSEPVEVVATISSGEEGEGPVVVLSEEFDNNTTNDSSKAIDNTNFPNFSGETSKAYTSQYGGLKLGTSSAAGYITSKTLNLSSSFTVQIDACKYGSDTVNIQVTVGDVVKTISNSDLDAAGSFKTFTLSFDAATSQSTVKIGTSSKRAYIDNVIITRNN